MITIVNYILPRLVRDACVHCVGEGWIVGGLIGGREGSTVESVYIDLFVGELFWWVDVITKLVNLNAAFGFVDVVSRVVVEGR
jgi:hypothetical protein